MHTHLSPSIRIRLSRRWSREAPAFISDDPAFQVDSLWMGPRSPAEEAPFAFLHCRAIEADIRQAQVLVFGTGDTTPKSMLLPLGDLAWLCHSSLPPASLSTVDSADPLLHLPGDSEAIRIRCLAQVDPTSGVAPTRLVQGIPGMRVHLEQHPRLGRSTGSFRWTPEGIVLGAERDPVSGKPVESSVGLALAAWFCSRTPKGSCTVVWKDFTNPRGPSDVLRDRIVSTYQALRLPSLLLFLVARAKGVTRGWGEIGIAEDLRLPFLLVRDRLQKLNI